MCGKLRLTFCLPDSCVSFLIHALLPPVLLPVAHGRRLAGLLSSKWTSRTFKGVWGLAQRQLIITDSSVYVHNCHNYRGAFLDTVTPSVGKKKRVFQRYVPTLCALVESDDGQRWSPLSPPWGDKTPVRSSATDRVEGHNWGTEGKVTDEVNT